MSENYAFMKIIFGAISQRLPYLFLYLLWYYIVYLEIFASIVIHRICLGVLGFMTMHKPIDQFDRVSEILQSAALTFDMTEKLECLYQVRELVFNFDPSLLNIFFDVNPAVFGKMLAF